MIKTLTSREKEVLALMVEGLSNKLIAAKLDIGDSTAKFHVANVCQKLGVTTRVEAAVMFVAEKSFAEGLEAAKVGCCECTKRRQAVPA